MDGGIDREWSYKLFTSENKINLRAEEKILSLKIVYPVASSKSLGGGGG